MEYTSFILGVLSVIFILMVVGMFRISRRLDKLEELKSYHDDFIKEYSKEVESLYRRIHEVSDLDNRRIDGEIDRVDHLLSDVYRSIDSRFDKLENKLLPKTANKQLLND